MKKLWLSVAVGAVTALAMQASSAQLAVQNPPDVDPWSGEQIIPLYTSNTIVDPWGKTRQA